MLPLCQQIELKVTDLTGSTTNTVPTEEDDIEFEQPSETKQLEGKHILLFVSNQTNASILRMHLTRGGAQVSSHFQLGGQLPTA